MRQKNCDFASFDDKKEIFQLREDYFFKNMHREFGVVFNCFKLMNFINNFNN